MAYTKDNIKQGIDKLRMCFRHLDNVIMCIKSEGREDAEDLIERVQTVQDDVAILIRDLRQGEK